MSRTMGSAGRACVMFTSSALCDESRSQQRSQRKPLCRQTWKPHCRWALPSARLAAHKQLSFRACDFSSSRSMRMGANEKPQVRATVVIIGGGIAGLSIALELVQREPALQVVVLSRRRSESAALAAGGMLAPQGERLLPGPLLDLCLLSRARYSAYVRRVERAAGSVNAGHDPCGLLAPAFRDDPVHRWKPPASAGEAHFLSAAEARMLEPALTEASDLAGAWYFPEDAQVDNQALMDALTLACRNQGVWLMENQEAVSFVTARQGKSQRVTAVQLASGKLFYADQFVLASGAWARQLMSVPVRPQKGQMLSVSAPPGAGDMDSMIRRVLYGAELYVAPKRLAGRMIVGSTVEDVGFDDRCTVRGIGGLLHRFEQLCPALSNWTLDRTWSGFRPITPDLLPILGPSLEYPNMFYALGHWRNGILLAPLVAEIIADDLLGSTSAIDQDLVRCCKFERFLGEDVSSSRPRPVQTMAPSIFGDTSAAQQKAPEIPSPFAATKATSASPWLRDERSSKRPEGASAQPEPQLGTDSANAQNGRTPDDSSIRVWRLADDGSMIPVKPGSGIPEPPDAMNPAPGGGAAVQWPWAVLDSLEEQRLRQVLEQTRAFPARDGAENGSTTQKSQRDGASANSTSSEVGVSGSSTGAEPSLNAYDDIRAPLQNGTTREASRTASASATATAERPQSPPLREEIDRMREGIAAALKEYEQNWDLDAFDQHMSEKSKAAVDEHLTTAAAKPQGPDAIRQSMFEAFAQIRAFMEKSTDCDDGTQATQ